VFAVGTKHPKDAPLEEALCSTSLISRVKVSISPLDTSSHDLLLLKGTEIIRDCPIFQGAFVSGEEGRTQRTHDPLNFHVNKPA
jgi:hypothetical protein